MVDPIDTSTLAPIRHDPTAIIEIAQADRERLAREFDAAGWRIFARLVRAGQRDDDEIDRPALRALARLRMEMEADRA